MKSSDSKDNSRKLFQFTSNTTKNKISRVFDSPDTNTENNTHKNE